VVQQRLGNDIGGVDCLLEAGKFVGCLATAGPATPTRGRSDCWNRMKSRGNRPVVAVPFLACRWREEAGFSVDLLCKGANRPTVRGKSTEKMILGRPRHER
jgi:hypothetical protein